MILLCIRSYDVLTEPEARSPQIGTPLDHGRALPRGGKEHTASARGA
jgi:hypothetical protein